MQKPHIPVRAVKLPRVKRVGIGSRTDTYENWGGPIAMVLCSHQGNIYMKRKLRVWRDRKCISLIGERTPLTCAGRQSTLTQVRRHGAEKENLRKLGWTYRHGTVFAPRQYLYQKETTGMERPEMCSPGLCENLTCAGR